MASTNGSIVIILDLIHTQDNFLITRKTALDKWFMKIKAFMKDFGTMTREHQ